MIYEEEKKIRIEDNSLELDKNNTLNVIKVGHADGRIANEIKDVSFRMINSVKVKVDDFIDINKTEKASPEAKKVWKKLSELEKFRKIVIIGLHLVSKVLVTFVIKSSGKKDFRFFNNKELAIKWLIN